mgnify:FL=1
MNVILLRHDWPEQVGFRLERPEGRDDYTFLHFMTNCDITVNGKTYSATPGACIFYSPGTPQCFSSPDNAVLHNWVHIDASLNDLLIKFNIPQNKVLYPYSTAFISEIFRKAEAEFYSGGNFKDEMLNVYMTEFLIKFSRALTEKQYYEIEENSYGKLREVRQKILLEPEHKWSVAEMAALSSLSPSRFHAVYKAFFGTSPMKDVIEARIYHAQSVLTSDMQSSIYEIAEKLGYTDKYHFIRQFKAATGETPAAYRKHRK